jgi:hypothetical protein
MRARCATLLLDDLARKAEPQRIQCAALFVSS